MNMKLKIVVWVLTLIFLVCTTGCESRGQQSGGIQTASESLDLSNVEGSETAESDTAAASAANSNSEGASTQAASSGQTASASGQGLAAASSSRDSTSSKQPSAGQTSSAGGITIVPQNPIASQESPVSSIPMPVISTPIPAAQPTAHQALKKSDYYGYQQLSAENKKIYDKIEEAVYLLQNDVNVSGTQDGVIRAFGYFLADHPQCFWINRALSMGYIGSNFTLHLSYLDGEKVDTYDGNKGVWTTFADRKKIESQIAAYQKQIAAVINEISPDLSVLEKEKKIHDYILQRVTYPNPIPDESHLYTSYGALIKKEAVCEGYSKLFQHLCYEVGINCLQVTGYGITNGQREAHMWNLIDLEGAWCQVDVTWDDAYNDNNILSYRYFNLTDQQMGVDHTIETDGSGIPAYPAPACTATKYHYYTNYCVNITKSGKLSADAAQRIKWALDLGDSYLYIVFPEGFPSEKLLRECIYGKDNSVLSTLKTVKPNRALQMSYTKLDGNCIIVRVSS